MARCEMGFAYNCRCDNRQVHNRFVRDANEHERAAHLVRDFSSTVVGCFVVFTAIDQHVNSPLGIALEVPALIDRCEAGNYTYGIVSSLDAEQPEPSQLRQ